MAGMPRADLFHKALQTILPDEIADHLITNAREKYQELNTVLDDITHRSLRKHLEENILPGTALYLVLLEKGHSQDRALEIIRVVFERWGNIMRKRISFLAQLPFFYGMLRRMIRWQMGMQFPDAGWEMEWVEVSKKRVAFNMRSCFYLEILNRLGVSELTPLYCWMDDLVFEGLSPNVKWDRRHTLARGDDRCDFCYLNRRQDEVN
jgi:hypothetical protein